MPQVAAFYYKRFRMSTKSWLFQMRAFHPTISSINLGISERRHKGPDVLFIVAVSNLYDAKLHQQGQLPALMISGGKPRMTQTKDLMYHTALDIQGRKFQISH